MKLHRFIGSFNFSKKDLTITDERIAKQVQKVLKVKIGEDIVLCDGNQDAIATVTSFGRSAISITIQSFYEPISPKRDVSLYCAVLKNENFEIVVQKATELGVSAIVPILTRRTVKQNLRSDRLDRIALEAAELSGRAMPSKIDSVVDFNKAMELAERHEVAIFFDHGGSVIKNIEATDVGLFIGPEGGWDDQEKAAAIGKNLKIVSLGGFNLRAETAAVVGSFIGLNF